MVQIDPDTDQSERASGLEKRRVILTKERIGSATSRYLSQREGAVNDIILETEES